MKNAKIYLIMVLAVVTAMVGCSKKNNTDPTPTPTTEQTTLKPGAFGLTQMQTNKRIRKQVINGITYVPYEAPANINQRTTANAVSFDLGNLKSSKSFYFMLSNAGGQAITNVTIESNNPQFEVFPKSIDKIDSAGAGGIVPLLELGVIHGNRLNGLGFQNLLPMGDNTVEVTIKGKTQGENGEEDVELKAEIKLFAEVMAVEFYINDTKQGFRDAVGNYFSLYNIDDNQTFKIKNTGNVEIKLQHHIFTQESLMVPVADQHSVLPAGETVTFSDVRQTYSTNWIIGRVFMDGNGAAVNPDELVLSTLKPNVYHITYNYQK